MTDIPPGVQDPPSFRAVLHPHRSLGSTGFLVLMGLFGTVSFVAGVVFAWIGAWPVLGFFGLDVLILYAAFKLNYRSGLIYETVELDRNSLTIERVHPSGRRESFAFNPYWVRVVLDEGRDGRTDIKLKLHQRIVPFGRFLTDDERRDFAEALSAALIRARGSAPEAISNA